MPAPALLQRAYTAISGKSRRCARRGLALPPKYASCSWTEYAKSRIEAGSFSCPPSLVVSQNLTIFDVRNDAHTHLGNMDKSPERKPRRAGADFLSQKKIEAILRAAKPGLYCDGRGLYLKLAPPHSASWVLKYTVAGRRHAHGLGPYPLLGLANARATALEKRRAIAAGQDPILATRTARFATRIATFREVAEKYIEAHAAGWKGSKSEQQWRQSLRDYVYPVIGDLPVQAVDTDAVLRCIEPLWATKPETASRVRGRIESILTAAKARGQRQGDNPAQWRGHLETILAPRSKIAKVQHFKALDYREMGAYACAASARGHGRASFGVHSPDMRPKRGSNRRASERGPTRNLGRNRLSSAGLDQTR
jgi:hypothetical protein